MDRCATSRRRLLRSGWFCSNLGPMSARPQPRARRHHQARHLPTTDHRRERGGFDEQELSVVCSTWDTIYGRRVRNIKVMTFTLSMFFVDDGGAHGRSPRISAGGVLFANCRTNTRKMCNWGSARAPWRRGEVISPDRSSSRSCRQLPRVAWRRVTPSRSASPSLLTVTASGENIRRVAVAALESRGRRRS